METRDASNALLDIALSPVLAGHETSIIHALLCSTDYGILMTDHQGTDILCNPRFGELFDIDPAVVVRSSREDVRRMAISRVKDPQAFVNLLERIYTDPTLEYEDEIELNTVPPRILRRYTGPVLDPEGRNLGRVWTFKDITETRRLQADVQFYAAQLAEQLEQQRRQLHDTAAVLDAMTAIAGAIADSPDMDALLEKIAVVVWPLLGHCASAVLLRNELGELWGVVSTASAKTMRVRLPETASQEGDVDEKLIAERMSVPGVTTLPLRGKMPVGVLALGTFDDPATMSAHHLAHLEAVADQAALAIERHKLHADLSQAYADLKEAQDQMVESAKLGAVGTLAAGVAHEIRNIMTPLQLELSMAVPNATLGPARAQVDRLAALTHRLLALTKPATLHPSPLRIKDVLDQVVPLIEPQADVSRVQLRVRYGKSLPLICGDAVRLEHLFINLALNALDAMASNGGVLSLSTKTHEGGVRVEVKDTGKGIASNDLPHIFEAFFTTRANGSGLGLFSVKRIVEEHAGRIEVKSRVGMGTCFSVWLPAAQG